MGTVHVFLLAATVLNSDFFGFKFIVVDIKSVRLSPMLKAFLGVLTCLLSCHIVSLKIHKNPYKSLKTSISTPTIQISKHILTFSTSSLIFL
ncbi:hypothetical protein Hanom_Chr00s002449g01700391 [Helianthus anomalus]